LKIYEKYSISLAIREMQIKTTLRSHLNLGTMAITKNIKITGGDVEKKYPYMLLVGM
jgi:hypothetical protein